MTMSDSDSSDGVDMRDLVKQQNRKNKKSGGFQSMGLSYAVFKGITRKGYKVPTPIQRKTVPLIIEGKDVVAMARTGSGKTAAFLIPMFEKLKSHVAKHGARALIMSPTRELALQTLKFTKELGKFTGLKAAVILGGDKMEDQFSAIHENPDIIIATPGRFLHVLMEMDLKLNCIEYVTFDEADRLFELGFQAQLQEILTRLPESRQTLLFSATLPKLLVDFAKAGLHEPTLLRLDTDTKLSPQLKLSFLNCRADDKLSLLLFLLQNVIKPGELTVVFAATKHHVEYLHMVLAKAGISSTYIYSSLDQTARKINLAKFQHKKAMVLVVTDLAARGIDIPMLDNVINYNFPAKPKLFVHRVGRVARAGRLGAAYSLISHEEVAHVLDLLLFLGRPIKLANEATDDDGVYGAVPQSIVDEEEEKICVWHGTSVDLQNMRTVIDNAYKQYLRSRPAASSQSVRRSKELSARKIPIHPMFKAHLTHEEDARVSLLEGVKAYKPRTTIFEVNSTSKTKGFEIMKVKRKIHSQAIEASRRGVITLVPEENTEQTTLQDCEEDELESAFTEIIAPKQSQLLPVEKKKKRRKDIKDTENFLPYKSSSYHDDKAFAVSGSFNQQSEEAVLDFTADDGTEIRRRQNQMKWDRKRKRFVKETGKMANIKKIKTESGQWIPATYKSNMYNDWLKRNKVNDQQYANNDDDDHDDKPSRNKRVNTDKIQVLGYKTRKDRYKENQQQKIRKEKTGFTGKSGKGEIRRKEQIVKQRKKKAKKYALANKNKKNSTNKGKGKMNRK